MILVSNMAVIAIGAEIAFIFGIVTHFHKSTFHVEWRKLTNKRSMISSCLKMMKNEREVSWLDSCNNKRESRAFCSNKIKVSTSCCWNKQPGFRNDSVYLQKVEKLAVSKFREESNYFSEINTVFSEEFKGGEERKIILYLLNQINQTHPMFGWWVILFVSG